MRTHYISIVASFTCGLFWYHVFIANWFKSCPTSSTHSLTAEDVVTLIDKLSSSRSRVDNVAQREDKILSLERTLQAVLNGLEKGQNVVVKMENGVGTGTGKKSTSKLPLKKTEPSFHLPDPIVVATAEQPPTHPCGGGRMVNMARGFAECVYEEGVQDLVSGALVTSQSWPECEALAQKHDEQVSSKPGIANNFVFVDVGSNLGTCGFYLASQGAKVWAFEPVPSNAQFIQWTMRLNNFEKFSLIKAAAADEHGSSVINIEGNNRGNSIVGEMTQGDLNHLKADRTGAYEQVTIPLVKLDDYVKEHVHLMKLDCQGHELSALKGAETLLNKYVVDFIKFEFSPPWMTRKNQHPVALLQFIWNHGFDIRKPGTYDPISPSFFDHFVQSLGDQESSFLDLEAVYVGPRSNKITLAGYEGYIKPITGTGRKLAQFSLRGGQIAA